MAEEISSPLLSLIKEQRLIDDLQYEEVVAELKRTGAPVIRGPAGLRRHEARRHPARDGHQPRHRGRVVARPGISPRAGADDSRQSRADVSLHPRRVERLDGAGGAGGPARPGAGRRNSIRLQTRRAGGGGGSRRNRKNPGPALRPGRKRKLFGNSQGTRRRHGHRARSQRGRRDDEKSA